MKQHSSGFLSLVADAKKNVSELTSQELKEKIAGHESFCLIDVREDNEWVTGHITGAIHLSKGIIERDIEKQISTDKQIVVYCSGGFRSALVANTLQMMGYNDVYSVDKGLQGWIDAGFSIEN